MSAPLGGAAFRLSAELEQFDRDLIRAEEVAKAASEKIAQALTITPRVGLSSDEASTLINKAGPGQREFAASIADTQTRLTDLSGGIRDLASAYRDILAATNQVSAAIDPINAKIAAGADKIAASATRAARAATDLRDVAESLTGAESNLVTISALATATVEKLRAITTVGEISTGKVQFADVGGSLVALNREADQVQERLIALRAQVGQSAPAEGIGGANVTIGQQIEATGAIRESSDLAAAAVAALTANIVAGGVAAKVATTEYNALAAALSRVERSDPSGATTSTVRKTRAKATDADAVGPDGLTAAERSAYRKQIDEARTASQQASQQSEVASVAVARAEGTVVAAQEAIVASTVEATAAVKTEGAALVALTEQANAAAGAVARVEQAEKNLSAAIQSAPPLPSWLKPLNSPANPVTRNTQWNTATEVPGNTGTIPVDSNNAGTVDLSYTQKLGQVLATTGQIGTQALSQVQAKASDLEKSLVLVQRALNAVNGELGKQQANANSDFGISATAQSAEKLKLAGEQIDAAMAAIARGDASAAVAKIGEASATAKSGLDQLNIAAAKAREGVQALDFTSGELTAEQFNALTTMNAEAESLALIQRQAAALTQALGGLAQAQAALTNEQRKADELAEKAGIARDKQMQQIEAAKNQATATYTSARASGRTVGPTATAAELEAQGLTAKEAEAAVKKLGDALVGLDRARASMTLTAEGLASIDKAAFLADVSLQALGGGDVAVGLARNAEAIKAIDAALIQVAEASRIARDNLVGMSTDSVDATLKELAARRSQLQTVRASVAGSSENLDAPRVRAEAEALLAIKNKQTQATREAAAAQAENAQQATLVARIFTGLQNTLGAIGLGIPGRAVGGAGRGAASLEQITGLSATSALVLTGALIALGSALYETVRSGLAFNAFIQDTAVRMEAASGSAQKAQEGIASLRSRSLSRDFGAFSIEDLAKGDEVLKRIGIDSAEMELRVANAAAATGKSYEAVASQVGHFYDVVRAGQPLGDIALSLERQGIITSEYGVKIKAAGLDGATAAEKMALINEALDRFSGTSARAGSTVSGSMERIKNALGQLTGALLGSEFEIAAKQADSLANSLSKSGGLLDVLTKIGSVVSPVTLTYEINKAVNKARGVTDQVAGARDDNGNPLAATQARYDQNQAAYKAGADAVAKYAAGFDADSDKAFSAISSSVQRHLEALAGGKLSERTGVRLDSEIEPLIAKITQEIQERGRISEQTITETNNLLGKEAEKVLELAQAYAGLRNAQDALKAAKLQLSQATDTQELDRQIARDLLEIDQQAVAQAEHLRDVHRQANQEVLDGLETQLGALKSQAAAVDTLTASFVSFAERQVKALEEVAKTHRDAAAAQILKLQDSLADYQAGINARRDAAKQALDAQRDGVDALNKQAQDAQSALSQHQSAYQAVLSGTVDLFEQEHTQQDAITRAIIEKWDAEISGLRRAKDEADNKVRAETEKEHLLALAYDRRAAAARAAGREDQARAIERERDRVIAVARQQGQVARDEAAVAGDKLGDATTAVQTQQTRQQSADQVALNAIQARAKAAQDALDLATKYEAAIEKAEDAEIKRQQAEIDRIQRVAKDQADTDQANIDAANIQLAQAKDRKKESDNYWAGEIAAADNHITDIKRTQKAQETADQQRIDDAKTILAADEKYWKERDLADQKAINNAHDLVTQAGDLVDKFNLQIAGLDTINTRLDDILKKQQAWLNILRAGLGLPPLDDPGLGAPTENVTPPGRAPEPPPAPGAPAPTAPARDKPIPGRAGFPAPPGYHTEHDSAGNFWYVPDGHHIEDYPEGHPGSGGGQQTGGGGAKSLYSNLSALAGGTSDPRQIVGLSVGAGLAVGLGGASAAYDRAATAGLASSRQKEYSGPLIQINTVNASDPVDVDHLLNRIGDEIFGTGIIAVDTARRGGVVSGRRR